MQVEKLDVNVCTGVGLQQRGHFLQGTSALLMNDQLTVLSEHSYRLSIIITVNALPTDQ